MPASSGFSAQTRSRAFSRSMRSLRLQLAKLDSAIGPDDMNLPGWRLHSLKGDLRGYWAVWVDENWRLTFRFDGTDAELVDYQDYH
jgi:proteic killer suppression protein